MRLQRTRAIARCGLFIGLLFSLLMSAACTITGPQTVGGSPSATTSAPSPSPTATSFPTATPFPTAAPVTDVAGWQTETSLHWVGYTFPQTNVTGLRAQWVEPTATGSKGDEEFVWLGVGGWGYTGDNIVQVGTFAYFPPSGGLNQGIWYEAVPQDPFAQYPLLPVESGDQIFASVTQVKSSPQTWQMQVVDATNGVVFTRNVQFKSLHAYPSFVVEAPRDGPASAYGPFYPFPNWSHVTFTQMQVRVGNTWKSAASLYGYRINMVRNGKTLATAGSLRASSSFTATQR
jgi:Peptidase A4 family